MAKEEDPGKFLMTIGILVFMVPIWTEMVDTLWFLFIVGPAIALVGVLIKAGQTGQPLPNTAAQGINPHLPTSRGIDFIEAVVGFADNPDTAVMPIGKQPEGTHPTMFGISASEFTSQAESYDRSSNRGDFENDEYNEFTEHGHERVLPLEMVDPISHWNNPVDEWQNPTKYW